MTKSTMDLRRPYRPCTPAPFRLPFRQELDPDAWFLAGAMIFTVALELLLGGWFVMAFAP